MHSLLRWGRLPGLALLCAFVTFAPVSGQDKPKSEKVNFETGDGVKIEGHYWASDKGKKAPVALLLHDFKAGKGGNCKADGWDDLAKTLNNQGFAVLCFDFRGHGTSTTIANPMVFWNYPQNRNGMKVAIAPGKPLPDTIGQAHFYAMYYPNLVNDIAAAKAFLDRKNDGGELNVSNLIVIGAGEGATVGALWVASEWHRRRGVPKVMTTLPITDPRLVNLAQEPEGKDVMCAIWLNLSPSIAGRNMPSKQWLTQAGKTNKVATAFLFGEEDKDSRDLALNYMRSIYPNYVRGEKIKDAAYEVMGEHGIKKTKLTGSKLLVKTLETEDWIANQYLKFVLDKRSIAEWRIHNSEKTRQWWYFPTANPALQLVPAKNETDMAPQILPLIQLGVP